MKQTHGFSLIEIVMTLAIISILLTLFIPQLLNLVGSSRQKQAYSQAMDIKKILLEYRFDPLKKRKPTDRGTFKDNGSYITLKDLVSNGYLKKMPIDPWGKKWEILFQDIDSDGTNEIYIVGKGEKNEIRLKVFACYDK